MHDDRDAQSRRTHAGALPPATLQRTAARYRGCGRFARHYVAAKLRQDPVNAALLRMGNTSSFGAVLDVGCGRGQLALALLDAGCAAQVIGLDWNAGHLAQARHAAGDLPFEARRQDCAADFTLPDADTVLMIDMLYQLPTAAQHALLHAAAQAARHRIVIRSADPARGRRSWMTRNLERLFRRIWPHSGVQVNARPITELQALLASHGFTVQVVPCWDGTPFSNVLLHAMRREKPLSVADQNTRRQHQRAPQHHLGGGGKR